MAVNRSAVPTDVKREVAARAGGKCERCGAEGVPLSRHHKIAKSIDGPDTPENIELLCQPCHREGDKVNGAPRGRVPGQPTFTRKVFGWLTEEEGRWLEQIAERRCVGLSPTLRILVAEEAARLGLAAREGE